MDTFREYSDSARAAGTESQAGNSAYAEEAYSRDSYKVTTNNENVSDQLAHRGLLPSVTLATEIQGSRDEKKSSADAQHTSADAPQASADATQSSRAEVPADVRRHISTLSNVGNGGLGYSEQVNQGLRHILDRHGVHGFNRMIGVLDELSNGNSAGYRFELRNSSSVDLENSLSNLERLTNPEAAQEVLDLNATMRQEGYTQRLSIEDLSPENIRILSTQPQQRSAFIEFNNEARHSMGPGFFLQENPELLDALPTEQLRLYRIWLAERNQR